MNDFSNADLASPASLSNPGLASGDENRESQQAEFGRLEVVEGGADACADACKNGVCALNWKPMRPAA
ncbi:MAG: hypothetical protein KGS72_02690 [Cyanobacteria bacterium REEB67]|nr:hypothetical protein [Cyanobacteria bacterium REEB67]